MIKNKKQVKFEMYEGSVIAKVSLVNGGHTQTQRKEMQLQ